MRYPMNPKWTWPLFPIWEVAWNKTDLPNSCYCHQAKWKFAFKWLKANFNVYHNLPKKRLSSFPPGCSWNSVQRNDWKWRSQRSFTNGQTGIRGKLGANFATWDPNSAFLIISLRLIDVTHWNFIRKLYLLTKIYFVIQTISSTKII